MGDRSLRVYDVATGKLVDHAMTDTLSSSIAVSPDGALLAQVDTLTGVVSIRDAKTLRVTGRDLVAPGFVTDLTWLDHGRRIATSSTDGFVHYWDVAERKQPAELPHGSKVEYRARRRRRVSRVLGRDRCGPELDYATARAARAPPAPRRAGTSPATSGTPTSVASRTARRVRSLTA